MNIKYKILFFSHNLELAGACWSLYYLARDMMRKGHYVKILSPQKGPLLDVYEKSNIDIEIIDYKDNDEISTKINTGYDLLFINTIVGFKLISLVKEEKLKIIWCIRESEIDMYTKKYKELNTTLFSSVNKIVFVSKATEKKYRKLTCNNSEVIYNGIDVDIVDDFLNNADRERLRKSYGFNDDDKIIFLPGTICVRKGQIEFVDSAIRLLKKEKNNNLKFLMVGSVEVQPQYVETILEEIHLSGYEDKFYLLKETEDIFDFYLISDIVVCNSYIESFPRVVLEAMAFSKPVIATNVYGIPEQLDDGQNGLLITAGDVNALSLRISSLLKNEKYATNLGINARNKLVEKFTQNCMIRNYEELIQRVFQK